MVYKRYIKKKNGKVFGPYYYESYRDKNGKVRTRFIKGPGKKNKIFNKIKKRKTILVTLLLVFMVLVILLIGNINYNITGKTIYEKEKSSEDVKIAEQIANKQLTSNTDVREEIESNVKKYFFERNKILEFKIPEGMIRLSFDLLDYSEFVRKEREEEIRADGFDIELEESPEKYKWGYDVKLNSLDFMARIDVSSNVEIVIIDNQTLKIGDNYLSFSDLAEKGYVLNINKPQVLSLITGNIVGGVTGFFVNGFKGIMGFTDKRNYASVYIQRDFSNTQYKIGDLVNLDPSLLRIIEIVKVGHLDSNREFIRDIYDYVKEKDDNWVLIKDGEFVRVKFEQNLTKRNDITIYARTVGSDSYESENSTIAAEIVVFRKNDSQEIARFKDVSEEKWYKIYLSNLSINESIDVFDLQMVSSSGGAGIELDYIVDPIQQLWNATYNSSGTDYGYGIDFDGDFVYVTGAGGVNDFYHTIKYNATNGNQIWNATYNSTSSDIARDVAVDSSGNVYVTGVSNNAYYTIKYNSSGDHQWNVSDVNGTAYGIATDDTYVYVTGESDLDPDNYFYTIKYDVTDGSEIWNASFGNGNGNGGKSVTVDSSGNVYVTGGYDDGIEPTNFLTLKYNSSGSLLWNVSEDFSGEEDSADSIAVADSTGNVYVAGGAGTTDTEGITVKYNSTGSKIWSKSYTGDGEPPDAGWGGISLGDNENVYVAGSDENYYEIAKYDTDGNEIWNVNLSDVSGDAYGIRVDGISFYVTGTSNNNFYTAKLEYTENPVSNLKSPEDYNVTNLGIATFECNATDDDDLSNITLYIWNSTGSLVNTNTTSLSGVSNSTTFAFNFTYEDFYKWNCLATDNTNLSDWGVNRTIIADSSYPNINFIYPTPDNATETTNSTIEINVSIYDSSLDEVTFEWDGTNQSLFDDGLILMMNLDNNSLLGENDTFVVDNMNNYNGRVIGATFNSTGRYGGGFEFHRPTQECIDIGDNIENMTYATFAAWVNIRAYPSVGHLDIISKETVNSFAITDSGELHFNVGDGALWDTGFDTGNVPLNEWHFVLSTWNGTNKNVTSYIDGQISGSKIMIRSMGNNSNIRAIGAKGAGSSCTNIFNGTVDEPRVWNRVLTPGEVNQLYMSNLRKYDEKQWYLYINQSQSVDNHTYNACAKDVFDRWNCTETRSVTRNLSGNGPEVTYISPISNTDPNEASFRIISFNITMDDADGIGNLNYTSVKANFSRLLETTRQSSSCVNISGENTTTSQNFTCTINMWYWDGSGNWNITVLGKDNDENTGVNNSEYFQYNLLKAIVITPSEISFNVSIGAENQTSEENTTINNTGNFNATQNISVNAINIYGPGNSYIDVGNFTVDTALGNCNEAYLQNATNVTITNSVLEKGNLSQGQAQEKLYYCITKVPPNIPSGTYDTSTAGSWIISI
jgi:hypothetical protein